MTSSSLNPTAMAFKILEEYKDKVREILVVSGCTEELRNKILKDLYATNDAYISLNRPYKRETDTFVAFCTKRNLHSHLQEMFPSFFKKNLYVHQVKAIDSILAEKTTIISTGTGSGKTESFLIPLFHHCLKNKDVPGIKAIILYPINALANDQLRRIDEAVKGQEITVGCYIGSVSMEARNAMIRNPPDILITNYVMLDRLLTKEYTRSMFIRSANSLRYLVVDEIHYYRGTKGANLCLLLRRLRTSCNQQNQLVQIGASATLRQGGGYYNDNDEDQIQNYARAIFGEEAAKNFAFITPIYGDEQQEDVGLDPLPSTDQIIGSSLIVKRDTNAIKELATQLAGKPLPTYRPGRGEVDPLYQFAKRNQFVQRMRNLLKIQACTIEELADLFRSVYLENYQREPLNPKDMVYGYLSVLNDLNSSFANSAAIPEVLLDYRLHLVLNDLGGNLTRCLLCGYYHDGLRTRCKFCNGLLFTVSKEHPELCLAKCNGRVISPHIEPRASDPRNIFPVLVQREVEAGSIAVSADKLIRFNVESNLDADEDDESYILLPAVGHSATIRIIWPSKKDYTNELELEKPRLYWQNVQRIIEAVLVQPETRITSQLLAFIDNREKASGIRFRLRDEIAEKALSRWAANQWSGAEILPLIIAYRRLEQQLADVAETNSVLYEMLREMPFWFARMLTRLDEYESWQICLHEERAKILRENERLLVNDVFLPHSAIDRRCFGAPSAENLKHFFLEKYRVATEYGVGLTSAKEYGYDIVSLGELGQTYQSIIEQIGSQQIESCLSSLANCGVVICRQTSKGVPFYQLDPQYLVLECTIQNTSTTIPLALIECHTADNTSKERRESEERFRAEKINALICTPTLEMGVDIGKLSCVTMIGFPPSPANYAQRAGRAGRSSDLRSATLVVLSSSGNSHDDYYAADPRKMIEGTITPPQFTLTNMKLLAAHTYAYLFAGEIDFNLLRKQEQFEHRLQQFAEVDELKLQAELGEDYGNFIEYLRKDVRRWFNRLRNHEQGYKLGFFPDYGFRRDGISLIDLQKTSISKEDSEAGVLTTREPEEAIRKLAPGRVVFCGGRPVRVSTNQPQETYNEVMDPIGKPFRAYTHLIAEEKDELYIYAKQTSDIRYQIARTLAIKETLAQLPTQGPHYCRLYFIRKGTLYVINEGLYNIPGGDQQSILPFHDGFGDYRVGTQLMRDGILIYLPEQILPSDTRANFLAVLLRCIPDYFNLDDGELRILQNVKLYSETSGAFDDIKYFFLYGHDESGLVPFDRIFGNISKLLSEHLKILEKCSCSDDGCYHCLFSFNSQYLTGALSRQKASDFLRAYLQFSLLQPHIKLQKSFLYQPDIILRVEWRGKCEVTMENQQMKTLKKYFSDKSETDQNTAIYTTMKTALIDGFECKGRTVKIVCKPSCSYVDEQLRGKAIVGKGREAFFRLLLTLQSWDAWASEGSK